MERNMAEGNEEQYFDLDKSFQELNIEELKDEEDLGCEPLLSPIVSPIKPGKRPTSKALPATPSREPPTKRTDTKATPVKEALKDDEAIRGPDQSFGTRPRPKPMVIDTSPSVLVQQSYYGATSVSSGHLQLTRSVNRLAVARYGNAEVRQRNFVVIQQRSEIIEFLLHTYAKQLGSVMEVKKDLCIFQDRAVVANLKYFGYKTVTDVLLPLKEMKKEEFGMELFWKEYVKIKDPNELISKDNLTDSDK